MDLQARLEWVLANRQERVGNESLWAERAKLTRTHVTTLLRRLRNPEPGKRPSAHANTFQALADVAGVSVAWLMSGIGSPHDGEESGPRAVGMRRFLETIEATRPASLAEARAYAESAAFSGTDGWSGLAWEDAFLQRFAQLRRGEPFGQGARELGEDE